MDGFFLIDKPAGMTSHDVVASVRRLLQQSAPPPPERRARLRVGHAGTLDPFATGLLIIGVGNTTKVLAGVAKLPKTYEAELTLGATSTTDDREGEIRPSSVTRVPSTADVRRALETLTGTLLQVPPAYSAVKIRGVPAYRRARRGESVALPARPVTVFEAHLLLFAYPHVRIRWAVSSGTYARALTRDLGERLGVGAYLKRLRRTAIGPWLVGHAVRLDQLSVGALRPSAALDRADHAE